jgi:FAD/FMN-containing dehydrogenase
VRPGTTEEVSTVVRAARDARVPIVPQGGNTGMCGGATPSSDGSQLVLSLGRLNRIRALDPDNATLTAEAGVTLLEVQRAATEAGLYFPLSLAAEGSCTLGGNLSTNAGGTAVLRFGNARELTLGLEVVLPSGEIWSGLRALRKDNTGYDLKQLFIGAEGTLGVITAAVVKLFPAPAVRATALAAVTDVAGAVALLRRLRAALGDRLTGFELVSRICLQIVERHIARSHNPLPGHEWYALIEAQDSAGTTPATALVEAALAEAADAGLVRDAVIAQSDSQRDALWALRENISEAQRAEGQNIKHDISIPIGRIPAFVRECNAAVASAFPGIRMVVFGHLGDGNLHYNVAAPAGVDDREFLALGPRINRIVHDHVHACDGSVSAEHGLGQLKRDEARRYKSAVEIALMQSIKQALDPDGLFNPGKVL